MAELLALAALALGFAVISARVARWPITGPMIFVAAGLAIGPDGLGVVSLELGDDQTVLLAEAALTVLLFSDAARIDLGSLRRSVGIPARLLGLGLPLTIGAGTGAVMLILGLEWEQAALVAAICSATDAALSQAVITDRSVPLRIRQTINVESGLNDGLALPAVTVFAAIAAEESRAAGDWVRFVAEQIGFGVAAGVAVGVLGGRLLLRARRAGWIDGLHAQLAGLALAGGAYAAATLLDGNGFVAAFTAGICLRAVASTEAEQLTEYAEDTGELLAMVTFVVFGNVLVGPALGELSWTLVLGAGALLTVVRMVPVSLALTGTGLRVPTVAFLGWFGPRGLASILFGLTELRAAGFDAAEDLFALVTLTVLASVVAHGVSAASLAQRYGAWYSGMGEDTSMTEHTPTHEMDPVTTPRLRSRRRSSGGSPAAPRDAPGGGRAGDGR